MSQNGAIVFGILCAAMLIVIVLCVLWREKVKSCLRLSGDAQLLFYTGRSWWRQEESQHPEPSAVLDDEKMQMEVLALKDLNVKVKDGANV
ncbi:hypothetical protein ElyMa_006446500 [Elysia marginata]|uniref:Uncharacterized protein n=1 Tax=Elysia marginata TaxID=1093978 RepID=A0AAV4I0M2_9GAST|nr:hypothetical protein ElyMa_006446500 [Elysia marginata]